MQWWEIVVSIYGWAFVSLLVGGPTWLIAHLCGLLLAEMAHLVANPQQLPEASRILAMLSLLLAPLYRLIYALFPEFGR